MKSVFLTPLISTQELVYTLMREYTLSDITIEEDDLGSVVERIYGDRQVEEA
jgi:ABC-type uncharacterized transport system ATPase subunit